MNRIRKLLLRPVPAYVFLSVLGASVFSLYWTHAEAGELSDLLRTVHSKHEQALQQMLDARRQHMAELTEQLQRIADQAEMIRHRLDDAGARVTLAAADAPGAGGAFNLKPPADEGIQALDELIAAAQSAKAKMTQARQLWNATPTIWPVPSRQVTSRFGYRQDPFTHRSSFHHGIDIAAPANTAVYAAADGTVSLTGCGQTNGYYIQIDHGRQMQTKYLHLQKILVKQGQRVKKGQHIGLVGSTGRSTGPHLHYEVIVGGQAVNPQPFLPAEAF